MGKFDGKVVIVTGSSAGIGQHAAVEFGKAGASVTIHGQNVQRLDQTEKQLLEAGVPAQKVLKIIAPIDEDSTPAKIVDATVAKFGRLDVLVNNAGTMGKEGVDRLSAEQLDYLYKVNFRSVAQLVRLALPHLEKTKGNIINVSSAGAFCAFPFAAYYCALKAALDHLTRAYAQMYGPKGVRVNSLNPGPVQTLMLEKMSDNAAFDEWIKTTVPLGRRGDPAEMSPILLFLASEDASYVNGAIWLADGGQTTHTTPFE